MEQLKIGDRVRVIEMPAIGKHFIGASAVLVPVGTLGLAPDDLIVRTERGTMLAVKAHQIVKAESE
jgi:hypothetical protein